MRFFTKSQNSHLKVSMLIIIQSLNLPIFGSDSAQTHFIQSYIMYMQVHFSSKRILIHLQSELILYLPMFLQFVRLVLRCSFPQLPFDIL